MTFKECRKYGREQMDTRGYRRDYGFMYQNSDGTWYFSFVRYLTNPPRFCLERSGVVDKIVNNHWTWDWERRGSKPKNEKGWTKRMRKEKRR